MAKGTPNPTGSDTLAADSLARGKHKDPSLRAQEHAEKKRQFAARKAGTALRRDFNEVQHLQVSRKGPADFVSIADKRAEQTLFEELRKARPDWGFLMEEGGEVKGGGEEG